MKKKGTTYEVFEQVGTFMGCPIWTRMRQFTVTSDAALARKIRQLCAAREGIFETPPRMRLRIVPSVDPLLLPGEIDNAEDGV